MQDNALKNVGTRFIASVDLSAGIWHAMNGDGRDKSGPYGSGIISCIWNIISSFLQIVGGNGLVTTRVIVIKGKPEGGKYTPLPNSKRLQREVTSLWIEKQLNNN